MSDLAGLIARLEEAGEGSRELDARVLFAINHAGAMRGFWNASTGLPSTLPDDFDALPNGLGRRGIEAVSPHFTTSIDAALTLVPEGCAWSVGCEIDFTPVARVFGHDIHADVCAVTPELALVIAALRARGSA